MLPYTNGKIKQAIFYKEIVAFLKAELEGKKWNSTMTLFIAITLLEI